MLKLEILMILTALIGVGRGEYILDDKLHGNMGVGVHNLIDGIDNEWNGDGNRIKGEKNAVKGNENKVQGNNNYIEGQGNVVGDISPEELARLQNEMAQKLQARFQNIFRGNPLPKQEITAKSNPVAVQYVQKTEESSPALLSQPLKIQEEIKIVSVVQTTVESQQPKQTVELSSTIIKEKETLKTVSIKTREEIQQVTLIFRSYGNRKEISDFQDLNDLQNSQTSISAFICKRFRLCSDPTRPKKRSISFSSLYPTFPSQPLLF